MMYIILNEIRSCFRSGSTIFLSILFPSLCTFFLGTLLENIAVSDSVVGKLNVAYCIENGGFSADSFEEFIVYNGSNAIQNRTVKALIDGYNQTAAAMTVVVVFFGSCISGASAYKRHSRKNRAEASNTNSGLVAEMLTPSPQAEFYPGAYLSNENAPMINSIVPAASAVVI